MINKRKVGSMTADDVMVYLTVAMKHARLMFLLVCLGLSMGLFYYNFARPVYFSRSQVFYQLVSRSLDADKVAGELPERTIIYDLVAPHVMERTAEKFGIKTNYATIVRKYIPQCGVRFNSENNLIIDVYSYSFPLARDWARVLVQEYLVSKEQRRMQKMRVSIEAFSQEMTETKKRIDELLDTKQRYRVTNEMTRYTVLMNQLQRVPQDLAMCKKKIEVYERAKRMLDDPTIDTVSKLALLSSVTREVELDVGQVISPATEGANNGMVVVPYMVGNEARKSWEDKDSDLRKLKDAYAENGRVFMSGHPKMVAFKKQIDQIHRELELELEGGISSFNVRYEFLLQNRRELEEKIPEYDEVNARYRKSLQEFNQLDAGQVPWQTIYNEMSKRISAYDFAEDKDRVTLSYDRHLEIRSAPVSPSRFKTVGIFFVLGIAMAIGLTFLLEYMDSRVTDVEQVEEALKIPGLGVVPKVADGTMDHLLSKGGGTHDDHHFLENFRVIRTNLILNSQAEKLPQMILVTSSMPREGKTVVASNLALSFAQKGEKTLLVDADLRRGRLHRVFECLNKPGLSDMLRDKVPLEDVLRPTHHENLTLLPCGKHTSGAAELVDSADFVQLLGVLRQKYDRIIVDTPPVLGLAETAIIQRLVDGVLFVIWTEYTPMRSVKSAIQTLQKNGAKFTGFVLNRLDFRTPGYRYKYFYYTPNYYTNYKVLETPAADAKKG